MVMLTKMKSNLLTLAIKHFKHVRVIHQIPKCSYWTIPSDPSKSNNQKVNINGTNIYYQVSGTGNHVLLCIPGFLGFGESDFGPQLKNLNKNKFTVVTFDPPGQGPSRVIDKVEKDWSSSCFQNDAKLASQLMEKLGHDKYSILGWSLGGVTAIHLAIQKRVKKLVTLACMASVDNKLRTNYQTFRNFNNWNPLIKDPMIKYYGAEYVQNYYNNLIKTLEFYYLERAGDMGHRTIMKMIRCPTLIVQGKRDRICPPNHAYILQQTIPNSKLQWFPKGHHYLHVADEKLSMKFNKVLEKFLDE